jgi:hypothetical protein
MQLQALPRARLTSAPLPCVPRRSASIPPSTRDRASALKATAAAREQIEASRAARNKSFIPLSKAGAQALPQWGTTQRVRERRHQGGVSRVQCRGQGGWQSATACSSRPFVGRRCQRAPPPGSLPPGPACVGSTGSARQRAATLEVIGVAEPPGIPHPPQAEFKERPIDLTANRAMAEAVSAMFKCGCGGRGHGAGPPLWGGAAAPRAAAAMSHHQLPITAGRDRPAVGADPWLHSFGLRPPDECPSPAPALHCTLQSTLLPCPLALSPSPSPVAPPSASVASRACGPRPSPQPSAPPSPAAARAEPARRERRQSLAAAVCGPQSDGALASGRTAFACTASHEM